MNIDRTRKAPRKPRRTARLAGAPAEPVATEQEKPKPTRRRTKKATEQEKGDG